MPVLRHLVLLKSDRHTTSQIAPQRTTTTITTITITPAGGMSTSVCTHATLPAVSRLRDDVDKAAVSKEISEGLRAMAKQARDAPNSVNG